MDFEGRANRVRSFVLGGLVGASAMLAAIRRDRRRRSDAGAQPAGLAAFEDAPCYREVEESDRDDVRSSR